MEYPEGLGGMGFIACFSWVVRLLKRLPAGQDDPQKNGVGSDARLKRESARLIQHFPQLCGNGVEWYRLVGSLADGGCNRPQIPMTHPTITLSNRPNKGYPVRRPE